MNAPHADGHSIGGFCLTVLATIGTNITQSQALFVITLLTGLSTLVYNVIKILKEWKQKK